MKGNCLPICPVDGKCCLQAPEQMKERDVFKASHDKQAQGFKQTAEAPSNPSESAQVTGLHSTLIHAPLHPHARQLALTTSPCLLNAISPVCRDTFPQERSLYMGSVTCRTNTRRATRAPSTTLMAAACLLPRGRGLPM